MPYIDKEARKGIHAFGPDLHFEEMVDNIITHIRSREINNRDGLCNYAISRIVAGSMKPDLGWRYKYLNRAYGTFLSAAAEFYRRLVAPYEDDLIKVNEDIPEYE